jgi:hypothetical protein
MKELQQEGFRGVLVLPDGPTSAFSSFATPTDSGPRFSVMASYAARYAREATRIVATVAKVVIGRIRERRAPRQRIAGSRVRSRSAGGGSPGRSSDDGEPAPPLGGPFRTTRTGEIR